MKLLKYLCLLLILTSCAQIVIPDGGEKDISPPFLIKSIPAEKSLNIYPHKITLYFNENIELKNQSTYIKITPGFNSKPSIKVKKNKIELEIPKDSLIPNTTYNINFGKSIADINEGNILENFSYTFSTGNHLDTSFVSGIASSVKENKPIAEETVFLQNTENFLKYTTSTEKDGSWKISNIANGNYTLFIFDDFNSNQKLNNGELYFKGNIEISEKLIVHKNKLITYYQSNDSIKTKVTSAIFINNNTIGIKLNKNIKNQNLIKYDLSEDINKKNNALLATTKEDSFILYHKFFEKDTIILTIQTDTLQKIIIVQPKKRTKENLIITSNSLLVRKTDPIYFQTNIPVSLMNSEKIKVNGSNQNFKINSLSPFKISLSHLLQMNKEVIFEQGAFTDINGTENKGDTFLIKLATEEQTGSYEFTLKDTVSNYKGLIRVKISDNLNEYLLTTFLNMSNKLNGLLPGNYTIEAWEDENDNSIWDEGNYYLNQNPEKIILKRDFILIKPNWDTTGVEIYID